MPRCCCSTTWARTASRIGCRTPSPRIVTHRCNNQKPLIATTNLPDADAGSSTTTQKTAVGIDYRRTLRDHIGRRARSRLFEMCNVITMPNIEDYRIRTGQAVLKRLAALLLLALAALPA